jgi:hypothetical protein
MIYIKTINGAGGIVQGVPITGNTFAQPNPSFPTGTYDIVACNSDNAAAQIRAIAFTGNTGDIDPQAGSTLWLSIIGNRGSGLVFAVSIVGAMIRWCSAFTAGSVTLSPPPLSSYLRTGTGTVLADLNRISQSVAFAASITPDFTQGNVVNVAQLTGAITVANPTNNANNGQQVTFNFLQDVTGGRVVSFGTNFKFPTAFVNGSAATNGQRSSITFQYDGTFYWAMGTNAWA